MNVSRGETLDFKDFEALADKFSKCKQGKKQSAYFVRGKLEPFHRKDVNLAESNLLIIDGDEGIRGRNAPEPSEVHEALKELKLNHFIYTSHSHTIDKNKFRVVIEAESYEKKDVKLNNGLILAALAKLGVQIKFVKEMNTWSQPWFVPTREDPTDKLFEYYSYFDGSLWGTQKETVKNLNIVAKKQFSNFNTLDTMHENIRTGKEFHEGLRNLSYQYIMDGMSPPNVKAVLRALMDSSAEAGTERWQTRYNDIDRLVDGAIAQDNTDFTVCDIGANIKELTETNPPTPPGRLGQLVNEAYESSRYPDHQIAIVSAIGVVAGICGRKFNVDFADKTGMTDPTALNVYMTLVGKTGSGKDGIKTFIEKILFNSAGLKPAASFLGAGEFTSIRALDQQVKDARSQVCIDGEAGISMGNKTGDKAGVRKAILSLYGRGHHNAWSDPKTYSNADETIPPRRAIALTRISESTEVELFAAYRDSNAFESGLIPRQSIFRIVNPTIEMNRNIRRKISKNLITKFNALIDVCSTVQAVEDPSSHFIYCKDDKLVEHLYTYADSLKKMSVDADTGRITQIMSSRMFVKALRYAGIAVVFNKDKEGDDNLVLDWEEWNWGKAMVEYELSTIESCFSGFEGGHSEAVEKVANCISKLINNTHKSKEAKKRMSAEMRKNHLVPLSVVQRLLRNDTDIKALVASDPSRISYIQDGVLKCIEYMVKVGAISLVDKLKVKCIKVLPTFNDLYNSDF